DYAQGGPHRPDLSGGNAFGEPAGGSRGTRNVAAFEVAPGSLFEAGSERGGIVRERSRRDDRGPSGIEVHILLHGGAGNGLRIGEAQRHAAVREILPRDAGTGDLSGAFAVRGGIHFGSAHRRRYSEDIGRVRGSPGGDLEEFWKEPGSGCR